jgi:XTP/dITP diphosphohydrolase
MGSRITLVLATNNAHKLRELRAILSGLPLDVVPTSAVLKEPFHVVEDGATFEENALKKARAVAAQTMLLTLADDSGLEVDALGGRPGVRSARFAHEKATDAENNAALLKALQEVDDAHRTARFRCVLAVVDPWAPKQDPILAEGTCEGVIAREGRGGGGFGYDPLFLVTERDLRTMAELSDDEKNQVSHRGRATAALLPKLRDLVLKRIDDVERVSSSRPSIGDALRPKR